MNENVETVVNEQFAVTYANHYRDGKLMTLGNYDAEMDTTDIVRSLRQQGFEPTVIRREITITYGGWSVVGGEPQ